MTPRHWRQRQCPHCGTDLEGLGTYCWNCERYTDDEDEPKPAPAEQVPDTRSEQEIRMAIRLALKLMEFTVLDFEQGWRRDGSTRVRKGLADLGIMGHGIYAWAEIKTAKGKQSPDQVAFADDCKRCGIPYLLWRHESQAIAWADEALRRVA